MIKADNKEEVKQYLLKAYPQFFQNGKVYEKETKDQAQFFYTVIYPLYNYEIEIINEGEWICVQCGQVHENKYISRPYKNERLYGEKLFCSETDDCVTKYKKELYKNVDMPDDEAYIKKDSPNYIYKVTEKSTGKCYIGKTRNAPFFRWWNHLTRSSTPFGIYLSSTVLSEWTFEVLEVLPSEMKDAEIFEIESKYIIQYDSINNGFNTLISKKQHSAVRDENQCKIEI